jgi:hypothetical protein
MKDQIGSSTEDKRAQAEADALIGRLQTMKH